VAAHSDQVLPPIPDRGGSRVVLAFPEPEDEGEFLALNRLSRIFHQPFVTAPTTGEQFRRLVSLSRQPHFVGLLARRRSDGAILGSLELSQISRGTFQSAYLGYQIGVPFARQGYMTEALRLVLDYAFRRLKLHRVEANIQPENRPSIALARRLRFRREGYSPRYLRISGRWRDHIRFAILAEEWRRVPRRGA